MYRHIKVQVYKDRKDIAKNIQKRCQKADNTQIDLWIAAWDNFKLASYHQIPKPSCFKVTDPQGTKNRNAYRTTYRLKAIRHFLPYFQSALPNLKGKAKKEVEEIIKFLFHWKRNLPPGLKFELEKPKRTDVNLANPPPTPQVKLQISPKHVKIQLPELQKHDGAVEDFLSSTEDSDEDLEEFFQQFQDIPLTQGVGRKLPPFP